MKRNTVWCPECRARAEGYLVPNSKHADCMTNWGKDSRDGFVLARDTKIMITEDRWRQEPIHGKRPIVWKRSHRMRVEIETTGGFSGQPYVYHLAVQNIDSNRSHRARLCDMPETFRLIGPGTNPHVEADAPTVAAQLAREDLERRDKVRVHASSSEAEAFSAQIASVFKALDIEVGHDTMSLGYFPSPGDTVRSPEHFTISMNLQVAARVVEALGGVIARPPAEPMPLWYVRYDEERFNEGIYVAARTKPAVITYMTAHYCHDRTEGNEPNEPLKPELLIIEEASPDPEVPKEEDNEDVA